MEKAIFEELKEKYGKHASFAVWNHEDLDDRAIIFKSVEELHGRVVFVGLNASDELEIFQNFHKKRRGGRDIWLLKCFNNGATRGAYMTDIIKNDISIQETRVDLSEENIKNNLILLKNELLILGCRKQIIVAIGCKTEEILKENGFDVYKIPHYAGRISRDNFLKEAEKLKNQLNKVFC